MWFKKLAAVSTLLAGLAAGTVSAQDVGVGSRDEVRTRAIVDNGNDRNDGFDLGWLGLLGLVGLTGLMRGNRRDDRVERTRDTRVS